MTRVFRKYGYFGYLVDFWRTKPRPIYPKRSVQWLSVNLSTPLGIHLDSTKDYRVYLSTNTLLPAFDSVAASAEIVCRNQIKMLFV